MCTLHVVEMCYCIHMIKLLSVRDRLIVKGRLKMPIQVFLVWLIGLVFIYLGYLVFSRKATGVLDYFLRFGVTAEDETSAKVLGTIIAMMGVIVIILPFILGIENMNF